MSVLAILADQAMAEPRIALVVGNGQYGSVIQLENPTRDATLIGESLQALGFDVTLLIDANQIEFKRGISQFGRDLRGAGKDATGLFYYAGHGVQSFGTNYLLPTDASLTDAADLDLVGIEAQSVLRQMFSAKNRTNIVILDACRNNPFENIADFTDNGLAEMKAPTGTFLSYATAPGGVALDGIGGNSPFTEALAAQIATPGQPIEQMFKQVRIAVLEMTRGLQTPWDTSSLTNDFMFVAEVVKTAEEIAELQLWNSVQATRDPVQVMLFLRAYPNSGYQAQARALLAEVMEAELSGTSQAKPPAPPPGPSDREREMFDHAQSQNSVAAYQAYLTEFPAGIFAEFAESEIASLSKAPAAQTETQQPLTDQVPEAASGPVTFLDPLALGPAHIAGSTIEKLILGSPLFPPVEGLPESYWKDQTCSNCHKWSRARLCEQAQFYLGLNAQRSLDKQHPYGGGFKRVLKAWAAGDCQ